VVDAVPAGFSGDSIGNPFATRHTRPGRIEPLDGHGHPRDVAALLDRLAALGGRAAIRGPHGSGKTTLLEHVSRALEARGTAVEPVRLRAWRDGAAVAAGDLFAAFRAILRSCAGKTVCIDGWEQLGPAAVAASALARLRGCGLVVTTHRATRLPLLAACDTSPAVLAGIVCRLPGYASWGGLVIRDADLEAAFSRHGGDIRESLYELYDRFEERRRPAAG
jgi:energy-coupling factor transporter ATP-binding protein EcfA2